MKTKPSVDAMFAASTLLLLTISAVAAKTSGRHSATKHPAAVKHSVTTHSATADMGDLNKVYDLDSIPPPPAAGATPAPVSTDNVYSLSSISPADLTNWVPWGGTKTALSGEGVRDPEFSLGVTFGYQKGAPPAGIYRTNLHLPLPREIRFTVTENAPKIGVILRDSAGHKTQMRNSYNISLDNGTARRVYSFP